MSPCRRPLTIVSVNLNSGPSGCCTSNVALPALTAPFFDLPLSVGRARGAGQHLAFLRQVEHDRSRIALGAIRALHLERALPLAREAGGGLGGGGRREREEDDCDSDEFLHHGFSGCGVIFGSWKLVVRNSRNMNYSLRSATRGSTREARRAGM